ncbi:MAG: RNA 2',3'-cyclic phosphodiesterase [Bacteroidales bacterium]|jgi:2'-5' RNA ligase|nr:RNA 2',3'-cyclic phosphodiesterase [Bacteroidales bacterium]
MKRLFLAIPLSPEPALLALLQSLSSALDYERINWVKPANMHLTLKFLGPTTDEKIPEIVALINNCVRDVKPFDLQFDKTGIFGSRYQPRVLWLGLSEEPEQLNPLANSIIDGMDNIGFKRDRQNFVPHLTLGRINKLTDKPRFQEVIGSIPQKIYISTSVDKLLLYESILRKDGPEYRVIESFKIG